MIVTGEGYGLGWLPDYPDFRDHTVAKGKAPPGEKRDVPALLSQLNVAETLPEMPDTVDLSSAFPPIEDQGKLGSCTANAGVALLEYFERNSSGKSIDASRLFLYKATRNLMGQAGDSGAFLRMAMQAMVLFGMPPEDYWPYDIATFDNEPTAFCYAFPMPVDGERRVGGHAIVACGFDDSRVITNAAQGATPTTGALLIRNSWGTGWGAAGYGWLPYAYVLSGLATDWWSLIKGDWVDTGIFGAGG